MDERSVETEDWRSRLRKPCARVASVLGVFWVVERLVGLAGAPDDAANIWSAASKALGAVPDAVVWTCYGTALATGGVYDYARWPTAAVKANAAFLKPALRTWRMNRRVRVKWFVFDSDEGRRISDVFIVRRRNGESVMVEVPDDSLNTMGVQLSVPSGYRLEFSDQRIRDKAYPVERDGVVSYTLTLEPLARPARFTAEPYLVFGDEFIQGKECSA